MALSFALIPLDPEQQDRPVDGRSPFGTIHPATHRVASTILNRLQRDLDPNLDARWTIGGRTLSTLDLVHAQRGLPLTLALVASSAPGEPVPLVVTLPRGPQGWTLDVQVLAQDLPDETLEAWAAAAVTAWRTLGRTPPESGTDAALAHLWHQHVRPAMDVATVWRTLGDVALAWALDDSENHEKRNALYDQALASALSSSNHRLTLPRLAFCKDQGDGTIPDGPRDEGPNTPGSECAGLSWQQQEEERARWVEDMKKVGEYPGIPMTELEQTPDDVVVFIKALIDDLEAAPSTHASDQDDGPESLQDHGNEGTYVPPVVPDVRDQPRLVVASWAGLQAWIARDRLSAQNVETEAPDGRIPRMGLNEWLNHWGGRAQENTPWLSEEPALIFARAARQGDRWATAVAEAQVPPQSSSPVWFHALCEATWVRALNVEQRVALVMGLLPPASRDPQVVDALLLGHGDRPNDGTAAADPTVADRRPESSAHVTLARACLIDAQKQVNGGVDGGVPSLAFALNVLGDQALPWLVTVRTLFADSALTLPDPMAVLKTLCTGLSPRHGLALAGWGHDDHAHPGTDDESQAVPATDRPSVAPSYGPDDHGQAENHDDGHGEGDDEDDDEDAADSESGENAPCASTSTIPPIVQRFIDNLVQKTIQRVIAQGGEVNDKSILAFGEGLRTLSNGQTMIALDTLQHRLADQVHVLSIPFSWGDEKRRLTTDAKKAIVGEIRDSDPDLMDERKTAIINGLAHPSARGNAQGILQDVGQTFVVDGNSVRRCVDETLEKVDEHLKKSTVLTVDDWERWLGRWDGLMVSGQYDLIEDGTRTLFRRLQDCFPSWSHGQQQDARQDLVRAFRRNLPGMDDATLFATINGLVGKDSATLDLAVEAMSMENTVSNTVEPSRPYSPTFEVEQQRFKPCRITLGEFNDSGRFKVLNENTPLRTVGMDPWAWQDALDRTFPWMSDLTARLVRRMSIELAGNLPLQLPTLALLGESGIGKTLYWVEAMRLLDHPFVVQSMAGINDSVAIKGTAAGWANARPSLAATVMASLTCGNPVILLDELDKAGGNDRNGHSMDALLPLLEHATARQYRDDCLQQALDTSHISWVVTLNDESLLSPTLRSRLEIVEVNGPDWSNPSHVEAALTLGEQMAWDAWPLKMRTRNAQLSSAQKDALRRTRWKSLRSLGQAIRAQVEENLYHESVDQVLAQRPAGAPSAGWRPTAPSQDGASHTTEAP